MGKGKQVLFSFFALLFCGGSFAVTVDTQIITRLDKGEVWADTLAVTPTGEIWVGRGQEPGRNSHLVEVYDAKTGKKMAEAVPPHTVNYLYPYSGSNVLLAGKTPNPWITYFSIGKYQNGQITFTTTALPETVQADRFAFTSNRLFFTEPGDARVYEWANGAPKKLRPLISGPRNIAALDSALFVVEGREAKLGDEDVMRIDLATGKGDRVFQAYRNGLTYIKAIPEKNWVAVSESLSDRVLLIDAAKNALVGELDAATFPTGMTQVGHCLGIVTASRQAYFYHLSRPGNPLIDRWDFSGIGGVFENPTVVSFLDSAGALFIRGLNPCPSCAASRSAVIAARESTGATIQNCQQP